MKVAARYRSLVATINSGAMLAEAARQLTHYGIGALAVWDGELEGILSERDLTRAIAEGADPATTPVLFFMRPGPYRAGLGEDVAAVTRRMLDLGVRHLPVVDGDEVIGMISMRDLLALPVSGSRDRPETPERDSI